MLQCVESRQIVVAQFDAIQMDLLQARHSLQILHDTFVKPMADERQIAKLRRFDMCQGGARELVAAERELLQIMQIFERREAFVAHDAGDDRQVAKLLQLRRCSAPASVICVSRSSNWRRLVNLLKCSIDVSS